MNPFLGVVLHAIAGRRGLSSHLEGSVSNDVAVRLAGHPHPEGVHEEGSRADSHGAGRDVPAEIERNRGHRPVLQTFLRIGLCISQCVQ